MFETLTRPLNTLRHRRREALSRKHLHNVLTDPHLAKDLGLPPRTPQPKIDPLW